MAGGHLDGAGDEGAEVETLNEIKAAEARGLAIWSALTLVLVLGYTFRDELRQVGTRIASSTGRMSTSAFMRVSATAAVPIPTAPEQAEEESTSRTGHG